MNKKLICSVIFFIFLTSISASDTKQKLIYIIVALCDNDSQGIVKVPKLIGDGNEPNTNLYWGASYGVKTFFKRSKYWQKLNNVQNISEPILDRIEFMHKEKNAILIAEAYRGSSIKQAIQKFIFLANSTVELNKQKIDLLVYIGHNGLMEFSIESAPNQSNTKVDIFSLACFSKQYFSKYFSSNNTNFLLATNGLLAPEAYILESALEGWLRKESKTEIQERAALAYNKYQKCGLKASRNLFK